MAKIEWIGILTSGGARHRARPRAARRHARARRPRHGLGLLIAAGRFDRMVAWQNRRVVDVPVAEAIAHDQAVDPGGPRVITARGLGLCFGD